MPTERAPMLLASVLGLAGLLALWLFGAFSHGHDSISAEAWSTPERNVASGQVLSPLPRVDELELDPAKVVLGRQLFNDKRMSADGTMSCASCHELDKGGDDGLALPVGVSGEAGDFNTLTVFNAAFNFRLFWNGRATTLEEQIEGPVHHPNEMGSSWPEIVAKLSEDRALVQQFQAVFGTAITPAAIKSAIAEYERTLITPDSALDAYIRGDANALSEPARRGYEQFIGLGCASCHQGMNVGGNMYQKLGIMADYFAQKTPSRSDQGLFLVTGREEDRHVFRVPSLRNVAETGPYFHDGSAKSLHEAVRLMAKYQLGRKLEPEELDDLVAFLKALSGQYREYQP